ncbi:MAG: flavin reductase family protein [Alphaproteobacteria bacterium]|nr:MAG: flavin reductase family protein [Alphaproteobacteria bacterium]
MFYRSDENRPEALRHNPFKAIVAPRPIGWISTLDAEGRPNLAPYSFFNGIADAPMMVMFASTGSKPGESGAKDSAANAEATGEFCCNLVSEPLLQAMNVTSAHYPAGVNEFEEAGLEMAPCELIAPPRVRAAPANLECRVWQVIRLPGAENRLVIGQVVGLHIREEYVHDGIFDVTLARPVARLGYRDYCTVREVFALARPGE